MIARLAAPLLPTVLALFALLAPCRAGVTCVEASRYSALAAIEQGDLAALARELGGSNAPPEGCRAVVLTGPADGAMVDALLDTVRRGRGWLAVVYLAFSDGDPGAETRLAETVRLFSLETVLLHANTNYVPDFIAAAEPLPASVSFAWAEAERSLADPQSDRYEDYARSTNGAVISCTRSTPEGPGSCAAPGCGLGCVTVLAGGIVRAEVLKSRSRDSGPPAGTAVPRREDDAAQAAVRSHYQLSGPLPRRVDGGFGAPTPLTSLAPMARGAIDRACRPRLDYLASRRAEIARLVDSIAARSAGPIEFARLLPKVRLVRSATVGVRLCAAQALGRLRIAAYLDRCREGCTTQALLQFVDDRVSRFVKPAAPLQPACRDGSTSC